MHHRPGRLAIGVLLALVLDPAAVAEGDPGVWPEFVERAAAEHGDAGRQAATFLAAHRPLRDADLDLDLLEENLRLALAARATYPWARALTDEQFLNDVLPYAVLDETRESWRPGFHQRCSAIVAGCTTATEAAQAINREFFDAINVHYNTGRKKPNQSPAESVAQGRATCTGLSIILVDACRSVGVPARVAGVANWHDKRGNHTWVEIWDDGWHFTGADEYAADGLNRAWFVGDARRARPGDPEFAVWATSWADTGHHFPMVWNADDTSVPGVDVSLRYVSPTPAPTKPAPLYVRVWDRPGGTRLAALVEIIDDTQSVVTSGTTKAGTADLNDMLAFTVAPATMARFRVHVNDTTRTATAAAPGPSGSARTIDLHWNELALSKQEAENLVTLRWRSRCEAIARDRAAEIEAQTFRAGDHELRIRERTFGDAPAGGHSLWISLHGGGGAPTHVNDRQWQNQSRLYEPAEGIYVAPRAPTDTWNLWHQAHVDPLFDRLIETYVATRNVNPDRVYLLGYSAGGDGVFQLAPRMADRFAAASMMAGHPNETKALGLRNLPFAIFMGGDDAAYDRNAVAARWRDRLAELRAADPDGYPHRVTIYDGLGHWMEGRDAEALPWLAGHTRTAWPRHVVWHQDDVTHDRFYWLEVPAGTARAGTTVHARVDGQRIDVTTDDLTAITLRLRDALVDLDRPVTVGVNGTIVHDGPIARRSKAIARSLAERADPATAATAFLEIDWTPIRKDTE